MYTKICTTIYNILMVQTDQALHFNIHYLVFSLFITVLLQDFMFISPYYLGHFGNLEKTLPKQFS